MNFKVYHVFRQEQKCSHNFIISEDEIKKLFGENEDKLKTHIKQVYAQAEPAPFNELTVKFHSVVDFD